MPDEMLGDIRDNGVFPLFKPGTAPPQEFRVYNSVTDCGLYLTKDGAICFAWDGVEIGYREFLGRVHAMKAALSEAIDILEHSDPPEGGRTDAFIQMARKLKG